MKRVGIVGLFAVLVMALTAPIGAAQAHSHGGSRGSRDTARSPLVIVFMENKSPSSITASAAPFLANLGDQGMHFTNYSDITHPSLPNYLALASGSTQGKTGTDLVQPGEITGPNLWDQLSTAGVSWGVYQELMPTTCYAGLGNTVTSPSLDKYAIRHDPAIVFSSVFYSNECQNVRPFTDMQASSLPDISFVTPSICDDMHGVHNSAFPSSCQGGSNALITRGDLWLSDHVPSWVAAGATVVITFDEGCKGFVDTVEVGTTVPASVDAGAYNHYSLLAGIEDRFSLPLLGNAVTAVPLPIS